MWSDAAPGRVVGTILARHEDATAEECPQHCCENDDCKSFKFNQGDGCSLLPSRVQVDMVRMDGISDHFWQNKLAMTTDAFGFQSLKIQQQVVAEDSQEDRPYNFNEDPGGFWIEFTDSQMWSGAPPFLEYDVPAQNQ